MLAPVARARCIALAVSGGADSLALLAAVRRWAARRRAPPRIVVLTVDHRLRRGSGREARAVAALAAEAGFEAQVLTRRGPAPLADVEAAARTARYRLLVDACRALGASHLLVAHHRDDVAETFLLRARRGSATFGLAAMRAAIDLPDPATGRPSLKLVRPFLAVPRARLAATTAAAGWTPAADPMNDDPRFVRTRVRRFVRDQGLDAAAIAALAFRFAAVADALDAEATAVLAASADVSSVAVSMVPDAFRAAPEDVRLRVLVRILRAVGGEDHPPRFARLSALAAAVVGEAAFKRTLAGVVAERAGGRVLFYRERGRDGLPRLAVRPGATVVWDGRFAVTASVDAAPGLVLEAAGEGLPADLRPAGVRLPRAALATLPALRRRGKTLAVLGLAGVAPVPGIRVRPLLAESLSRPPLFPA